MVTNGQSGVGFAAGDPPALTAALSQTLMLLGGRRPNDALAVIARLTPAQRADPRVAARAAYAFSLLGRIGDALAAARMALAAPNPDLGTLDLVGNSFTLCQQPREAHAAFQRAVALAPDNPAILFNLLLAIGGALVFHLRQQRLASGRHPHLRPRDPRRARQLGSLSQPL